MNAGTKCCASYLAGSCKSSRAVGYVLCTINGNFAADANSRTIVAHEDEDFTRAKSPDAKFGILSSYLVALRLCGRLSEFDCGSAALLFAVNCVFFGCSF